VNYPVERPAPPAAPARIGQGTAVEQSRAVAEVQAAIVVAQQVPARHQRRHRRDARVLPADVPRRARLLPLLPRLREHHRRLRPPRPRTGPLLGQHPVRLVEMRRDDEYGQSEMQAFAWDVETNSRNSSTFIVPHKRDQKGGPKQLTDMRDIYENNANNGARRVREAIFAILPPWFVEEAKQICNQDAGRRRRQAARAAHRRRHQARSRASGSRRTASRTKLDRPSGSGRSTTSPSCWWRSSPSSAAR
jgi:hypothetical protein